MNYADMDSMGDYANLKYELCILKQDNIADWSDKQQLFRFAVVNHDKAKTYPMNFVCILPMRVNSKVEKRTEFEKLFGNESLEEAKKLLTDALKSQDDKDLIREIERRLSLLEPKPLGEITCASCGKNFQAKKKSFRKRYCEDCLEKKFGSRT